MALITLAEAKWHLRITTPDGDPRDNDLQLKMLQAEAIVLDYLGDDAPQQQTIVKAAILIQLGELYGFRGDDKADQGPAYEDGHLCPMVMNLLRRLRDPTLA